MAGTTNEDANKLIETDEILISFAPKDIVFSPNPRNFFKITIANRKSV
ncbi:hypothetical protein [Phyllobacterium sp. YR531]|nr:hypothetical protein [Phyllobacterium sp. YR531]